MINAVSRFWTGRTLIIGVPWLWLGLFFLLPFLFILKISLSQAVLAQPPYTDLLGEIQDGLVTIQLNFGNYLFLLEDPLYLQALWGSVKVAGISTLLLSKLNKQPSHGGTIR